MHVAAATFLAMLLVAIQAHAGTEALSLASTIQYPKIVQGYINPITAYVYNGAPAGSDTGNYNVTAAYAAPHDVGYTSFDYYYTGSKIADGGTSYATASFPLGTSTFDGGTVAVTVTLTDTDAGTSVTQGGQFTVVDHATPGLYINGQVVPLSSQTVIKFTTPVDMGALGAGSVATASSLGMQGRSPTAELDLDSVTSTGSPEITSTLSPYSDLPSDSDPSEGRPFELDVDASVPGHYSKKFDLHYSDEDDLPGADTPSSQLASFTVDCDVTATQADWTITTVPEPASWTLAALAILGTPLCFRLTKHRHGHP
jgi:hypothetical protein